MRTGLAAQWSVYHLTADQGGCKGRRLLSVVLVVLALSAPSPALAQLQAPHTGANMPNGCYECHNLFGPSFGSKLDSNKGTTIANLCLSCHYAGGPGGQDIATHQGLACTRCHNPHIQEQNVVNGSSYGMFIKAKIGTPSNGTLPVKLLGATGTNSFADDDATDDGICEVCHTTTSHHAYGGGPDTHNAGTNCMGCHAHSGGFAASGGGTSAGHDSHTSASNPRSPGLACGACHDTSDIPSFKSGTDGNGDGKYNLAETDVCNTCHSPGGSYNGVTSSGGSVGAKNNWSSRVYSGNQLQSGKERWCAGCHDESPSVVDGVTAPAVIGNESASTAYGTGYGFYRTGHGLASSSSYPASGGTVAGANLGCLDCHDASVTHVDGTARTYVYTAAVGSASDYQHGYRLRSVGGQRPLNIPRTETCGESGVSAADFRLCLGCHTGAPFTSSSNTDTNFRDTTDAANRHYTHLATKSTCGPGPMWQSDWRTHGNDSRASCPACHNVHGSSQLSMVRDGALVGRSPGLELAYYNASVSYLCSGPSPHGPTPDNVTLPNSTGTVVRIDTPLCSSCHGSCGYDWLYLRSPVDKTAPFISSVYGRVGGSTLAVWLSEGVYTTSGGSGALVPGDFAFTDADNGRTLQSITHTAGARTARLTLSSALDASGDVGVDTLAAATAASIYDDAGNAMATTAVTVTADSAAPTISSRSPANGATSVPLSSNLSFTLADGASGVDWTSFSITLLGDKGYSQTYTDLDTSVVSTTGSTTSYQVTVNPGTDFGTGEVITVTVNASDNVGNALTPPGWSFTTVSSSLTTITLHPSGLASSTGSWSTTGGTWADVLDGNDGDTSFAVLCCTSPGFTFYAAMDNSAAYAGKTIQDVTVHVRVRYRDSPSPGGSPYAGVVNVGYRTGSATVWRGNFTTDTSGSYNLVSTTTYSTDSDGGALDATDIDNLQLAVTRNSSGSPQIRVTEVYAVVSYWP